MGRYVYITRKCLKEARKYSLENKIKDLGKTLEAEKTLRLLVQFGHYPYYKKRFGDHRLVVREKRHNENLIVCFLAVLVRGGPAYTSFLNAVNKLGRPPHSFTSSHGIPDEDLDDFMKTRSSTPVESFPELEDDDANYLAGATKLIGVDSNNFCILESEAWTEKIKRGDKPNYLSQYAKLVTNLLDEIERGEVSDEAASVASEKNGQDVAVLYKYFDRFKKLFLIAPLDSSDYAEKDQLMDCYNKLFLGAPGDHEQLIKSSARSYPDYLTYEDKLWFQVEKDETGATLALSPEELEIIGSEQVTFPTFINGRPGSGKSTMLHYLFSNSLANYLKKDGNNQPPLFLSYNNNLVSDAKKKVEGLLKCGATVEMETLDNVTESSLFNDSFGSYVEFLHDFLPEDKKEKFPNEKYVDFTKFSKLWSEEVKSAQIKISAELIWHVIRTYIKGMRDEKNNYFDLDAFNEYPGKRKTVEAATFKKVYNKIWKPWYKEKLCDGQGYWDDQDITRELLDGHDCELERFSAIYCDEAQDFTNNEIELILKLSKFSNKSIQPYLLSKIPFVFAGDPFQTLNPTGFSWELAKSDFHDYFLTPLMNNQKYTTGKDRQVLNFNFKELNFNYRSAGNIVSFSNLIQLLRGVLFNTGNLLPQKPWKGDLIDSPPIYSTESPEFQDILTSEIEIVIIVPCEEGGEIDYVKNDSLLQKIALHKNKITRPVLSPIQAKGLEFPRVVLYKFGERCLKKAVHKDLIEILEKCCWDKSLEGEKHIPSTYFLNKLYVAVSRAQNKLIVADTNAGIRKFWGFATEKINLGKLKNSYSGKDKWSEEDLTTLQPGKRESWVDNKSSPLDQAENFYKTGKANKKPYLLQMALNTFARLGDTAKKLACEAEICEMEGKNVKAGEVYRELGATKDAVRCYWRAKKFDKIVELNNEDPLPVEDLRVLIAGLTADCSDMKQCGEVFEKILNKLNSSSSELNFASDQTWGHALGVIFPKLSETAKSKPTEDIKPIWQVYKKVPPNISEKRINIAHFAHLGGDDDYAFQVCLEEKPHEVGKEKWAVQLMADTLTYPENLSWLGKLSNYSAIVTEYLDHEDVKIAPDQIGIIWSALQEEGSIDNKIKFLIKAQSPNLYKDFLGSIDNSKIKDKDQFLVRKDLLSLLITKRNWKEAVEFVKPCPNKNKKMHKAVKIYFIKMLARSRELIEAPRSGKNIVGSYLKEELMDKPDYYSDDITMLEGGSAIERANKHKDALAYYRRAIANDGKLLKKAGVKLAKERWVSTMSKLIKATSAATGRARLEREFEKNKLQWSVKVENIPTYPKIDSLGASNFISKTTEGDAKSKAMSRKKAKKKPAAPKPYLLDKQDEPIYAQTTLKPYLVSKQDKPVLAQAIPGPAIERTEFKIHNTTLQCEAYKDRQKIEIRNLDTQELAIVMAKDESLRSHEVSPTQTKKTKTIVEWRIEDWGLLCRFKKNIRSKKILLMGLGNNQSYETFFECTFDDAG